MIPFEREQDLEKAYDKALAFIDRLGFRIEWSEVGDSGWTYECRLISSEKKIISNGYGKGGGITSKVGAVYESLEHLYSRHENNSWDLNLYPLGLLTNNKYFMSLPFSDELSEINSRNIPCYTYEDIFDRSQQAVPAFLVDPYFKQIKSDKSEIDCGNYYRFGTNSGCAIGLSVNEAQLHGFCEVVERDSESLFLISNILLKKRNVYRHIDRNSLPKIVYRSITEAESRIGLGEFLIIDVTSDIRIPCFIVTLMYNFASFPVRPHGSGCSINPEHAAIRAICELVQVIDFYNAKEQGKIATEGALLDLKSYPGLCDVALFNINVDLLNVSSWDYNEGYPSTPTDIIIKKILKQFIKADIDMYSSVLHLEENIFLVVSVVSFSLERFFLVRSGALAAPGRRGQIMIEPEYTPQSKKVE